MVTVIDGLVNATKMPLGLAEADSSLLALPNRSAAAGLDAADAIVDASFDLLVKKFCESLCVVNRECGNILLIFLLSLSPSLSITSISPAPKQFVTLVFFIYLVQIVRFLTLPLRERLEQGEEAQRLKRICMIIVKAILSGSAGAC